MSLQQYPAYALPLPKEVYELTEENSVIRTAFESGRYRQRNRFQNSLKYFKVTWGFNPQQFMLWRVFVLEGISNGADYFTMDILLDDVLSNKTVRIVDGGYSVGRTDNQFLVTATIELENYELNTYPGLFSLYEALAPDSNGELAIKRIDSLHTLVHDTLTQI